MTRPSLLHSLPPARTVETTERVRWNDSDPFGIIYYGAYVRLFQVGEEELFRAAGLPFKELRLGRGVWIPRKALEAEFHSPAELDEEVVVRSWFARVGRTAITIRFDVHRAEDMVHRASGALTVVSVHKESMTPQPLPDDVREKLLQFSA
ncbi:MAG: thioesterase family protein [Gemmatimonadetes bacterium]|nr:thioesterase family protein [Gemmatimonadota bacterium]